MAAETQYTANTGIVAISTANINLDGTGTMGTVITAAANGTLVKNVFIKATANNDLDMIRLFVTGGGNTRLLYEIKIPATTGSSTDPMFETVIPLNFNLKAGYILKASTHCGNSYNVIGEGLNFSYYSSSVRSDTTLYTTATNFNLLSTSNPNLNGSGTITLIMLSGTTASGFKGCRVKSIIAKAMVTGNNTKGMVRIFIGNGSSVYSLFKEIPVPVVGQAFDHSAFEQTVEFDNTFDLQADFRLGVTIATNQMFTVTAEAQDWKYQP